MAASCTRGTSNSHDLTQDVAQYEAIIRVMEEEKDYYKKEYEALKAARRSAGPIKVMPNKVKQKSPTFIISFIWINTYRQ